MKQAKLEKEQAEHRIQRSLNYLDTVSYTHLELAENIWKEIRFSQVMDVDDEWMQRLFDREINFSEFISEMKRCV